jgi:hypothetical protein
MERRVVHWVPTDVLEEHIASIFRVEKQAEQETSVKAGGIWYSTDVTVLHLMLAACFHAGFFIRLFLDPEDGGDMLLLNVGWLLTDYTALYPRGWHSL